MATPEFSCRLVLEQKNDTGEQASKTFDETVEFAAFADGTFSRKVALAPSGTLTLAFTGLCFLHIYDHSTVSAGGSNGFTVKGDAADTTVWGPLTYFSIGSKNINTAGKSTSVIIANPSSNTLDLEITMIERVVP